VPFQKQSKTGVDILIFILTLFSVMASIWKHPKSPYWTACFSDETGKARKRSTKTGDRKQALKMAIEFESAAKKAGAMELTLSVATKVLSEFVERVHGESLDTLTIADHFTKHLASLQAGKTRASSLNRYRPIFDSFLAFLGPRASRARLASVTVREVESWRDSELASGKSISTANFAVKVLSGVFTAAKRRGEIPSNPCQSVGVLEADAEERIVFTDAQIRDLLEKADGEWTGMVLFGYHCGLRLADAANLRFNQIADGVLTFRDKKTSHRKRKSKQETKIVLAADLREYLANLPTPINPEQPIFSSLAGKASGSHGGLSNSFARLMSKAGIDAAKGEAKEGKGRQFSSLSFHSLRHTCLSRLSNSGASATVTKQIAGHSTDAVHEGYLHTDLKAQRKIIKLQPRLLA